MRERLERLSAGESVPYIRQKFRRIDGSLLDVEVAALPLRYGSRDAVQVIARDITESVRAQQALEASEQRYRELVEDVTDILYTVDHDGLLRLAEPQLRAQHRLSHRGVDRPPVHRALHAAFAGRDDIEHALATRPDHPRIRALRRARGAVVTVEVSSQPRYVDGVAAGTIGMARDVTEQRTIARKLEEAKRMSSLGQVAASLAHEFNNVLMGIQPFVEVIARNAPATRAVSDALGHITRAIGRGKRASQEILRFANPKEPQLFAIDVADLAADAPRATDGRAAVVDRAQQLDGARRALHPRRRASHLEQVITNLVFNARDAITGSGTIHVGVSLHRDDADAELVRISVCDDGPGIAPEILDRIFEPLFTTKRNGTGLGLAIARRLMEGQGGALTAENRPAGRIARFTCSCRPRKRRAAACSRLVATTPGVKRILLVEDDLSVGAGLDELLQIGRLRDRPGCAPPPTRATAARRIAAARRDHRRESP